MTVALQVKLAYTDTAPISVFFAEAVHGTYSAVLEAVDIHDQYVGMRWSGGGSAYSAFVPWSNIKFLGQVIPT